MQTFWRKIGEGLDSTSNNLETNIIKNIWVGFFIEVVIAASQAKGANLESPVSSELSTAASPTSHQGLRRPAEGKLIEVWRGLHKRNSDKGSSWAYKGQGSRHQYNTSKPCKHLSQWWASILAPFFTKIWVHQIYPSSWLKRLLRRLLLRRSWKQRERSCSTYSATILIPQDWWGPYLVKRCAKIDREEWILSRGR